MGIKLGNDYLLWVVPVAANAEAVVIGGQGDLAIKRTAATISTGSKTSGGYDTKAAGLRDGSATLKFNVELPDPGFTALEPLGKANPPEPFTIQVRGGGEAGTEDDIVFECSVFCTDFNDDYSKNGVVSIDTTFVFAGPPSIDTMK